MLKGSRQSIALTVAISMIGQLLIPAFATAHTGTGVGGRGGMEQFLNQSDTLQPGQPRGSYAPDRFLVLDQEVVAHKYVGKGFGFLSNQVERDIEFQRSRVERARIILRQVETLRKAAESKGMCDQLGNPASLSAENVAQGIVAHLNSGRSSDHPDFVWNVKGDANSLACVEERVRNTIYDWNYKVGDMWAIRNSLTEVANVTSAPEKERNFYVNWWDATVNVLDRTDGSVVERLALSKNAHGRGSPTSRQYTCTNGESCRFSVASKGQVMNRFHLPTKSIVTLGPYIVFIHENSFDAASSVQYLSFLDLSAYGASIGKADIPVFRLPIAADAAIESLSVSDAGLVLNNKQTLPVEAFMMASEMQQATFNITANFTDPESIAAIVPYLDSIEKTFDKITKHELNDVMGETQAVAGAQVLWTKLGQDLKNEMVETKALAENANKALTPEQIQKMPEQIQKALGIYSQGVAQSQTLKSRVKSISQRLANSRTLKAKLQVFMNRLTSPVPAAALKVKRALLLKGAYNEGRDDLWLPLINRPWLASSLMAAGMLAAFAPGGAQALADGGLAIGNAIFDYGKFAMLGMAESFSTGTKATFSPLFDAGSSLYRQYVEGDQLYKTAVGVSAFVPILLSLYYIPHLIFNIHQIALDSRKPDWNGFVEHQRRFHREYYERLAKDEAKRRKMETRTAFDQTEEEEIAQFIAQREATSPAFRHPGFLSRAWRRTADAVKKMTSSVRPEPQLALDGMTPHKEKVSGLWSAIMSVTFSYPAMELTLTRWTKAWNWFAGARFSSVGFLMLKDIGLKYNFPIFVRMKPLTIATRLTYPDFFNTAVVQRGPKVTIPTEVNGGLRGWGMRDLIWLKEGLFGKPSAVREAQDELTGELTNSEMAALSESFEQSVTEAEDAVFQVAFAAALKRLPDFIADKKELEALFKQAPLRTVFEKRISELPVKTRTFLRLYFEQVYRRSMTEFLAISAKNEGTQLDMFEQEIEQPVNSSPGQLKKFMLERSRRAGNSSKFVFDANLARQIAERVSQDPEIFNSCATQAKRGEWSWTNFKVNRKYGVLGTLDPEQNGSLKRFSVVQERLKSPNAVARATRAEISKLLITMPLDIAFKLFLSAGIFEGAFKPIQDQMFDTNSIFYLSRDSFYMTMAAGFVMGMMADCWVKLQTDERQDSLGDFGQVPKGEDADKSFLRWYGKQFRAKNNSILANWHMGNRIAFWNFPAALVNMGLFYGVASGRLDLSYILGGYILAFATPATALVYKIDQAFERASDFAARGIKDEKWMAHPAIQELIAKEKQYYRNRFQLLNDMWGNIQGNWLGNVTYIPTSYGTRGLVRAIFGGSLIEEGLVRNVLQPLQNTDVPGIGGLIKKIAAGCEHLLTNGNVDLNLKK